MADFERQSAKFAPLVRSIGKGRILPVPYSSSIYRALHSPTVPRSRNTNADQQPARNVVTPDPTARSVARTINGGAGDVGYRQTCSRADCCAAVRPAFRDPRARLSINAITSVIRTRRPSGHVERDERAVVLAGLVRRRRNRPRRARPSVARCRFWPWRCGVWPALRNASSQFPAMTLQSHPGIRPAKSGSDWKVMGPRAITTATY